MPANPAVAAARKAYYAKKALKAMHGYWSEYQTMPSLTELGARMGLSAKSWVHTCVGRLIESGHIAKLPSGRMVPGDKFFDEI